MTASIPCCGATNSTNILAITEEFYKINDLKNKSHLKVGRYYEIPVLLYTFNGKTIRSSIGVDNWTLAKKIEAYNDEMLTQGNREASFKKG